MTTMTVAPRGPARGTAREHLHSLDPEGRLEAYRSGSLSRSELTLWASTFPEEVPTVNGELEWIALALADLD